MAMVLDRLFLWIFTMAVVVGTALEEQLEQPVLAVQHRTVVHRAPVDVAPASFLAVRLALVDGALPRLDGRQVGVVRRAHRQAARADGVLRVDGAPAERRVVACGHLGR